MKPLFHWPCRLNLRQYQRKSRPEGISLGDANITSDNSKTLINSACWILVYYPNRFLYFEYHYECQYMMLQIYHRSIDHALGVLETFDVPVYMPSSSYTWDIGELITSELDRQSGWFISMCDSLQGRYGTIVDLGRSTQWQVWLLSIYSMSGKGSADAGGISSQGGSAHKLVANTYAY